MDQMLPMVEIEAQAAGEWVLVGDPQTDQSLRVQAGKLLFHSKDRDEVYRKAIELHPRRFAVLYTGKIPKEMEIVL